MKVGPRLGSKVPKTRNGYLFSCILTSCSVFTDAQQFLCCKEKA